MSDKPARVALQVVVGGVHYHLDMLKLIPHETRAINLRELRDAQKADFQGNQIPADATDGSVSWVRLDNVAVAGRLLVLHPDEGFASNYDCGACCCPPGFTAVSVSPGTDYMLPGGTSQFLATETITDCNGVNYLFDITASSTWSSSDTTVATVGTNGLVTGWNGGTATVTATFSDDFTSSTACVCFTQPRTRSGSGTCNVARLRCGTTAGQQGGVTRGSTVICQINNLPSGATTSNWQFAEGTNTVTPSTNPGTSWAGTAVIGGTVSVTATAGTRSSPLSAPLTVNARSGWSFPGVSPTKVQNNTNGFSLPSPPSSGSTVGASQLSVNWDPKTFKIGDNGPNNGFNYVTAMNDTSVYNYVISPDLENTLSAFYTHQCGNYSASTNPNGYISGATLLANTTHHESQRGGNSHYDQYMTSQSNSSNNLMTTAESFVEGPSVSSDTFFKTDLPNLLNSKATVILTATAVENCHSGDMSYNANCVFQGFINVADSTGNYQTCP